MSKNEINALNENELQNVTGGAGASLPDPKYPIGTPVLQDMFREEIGQDSGEVIAYGWYDGEKYSYVVRWRIQGERKHSEDEIERLYRCWDLSR